VHAEGVAYGHDPTIHELQKKLKGIPANSEMEVIDPLVEHDTCCSSRYLILCLLAVAKHVMDRCDQCSSCIRSHACMSQQDCEYLHVSKHLLYSLT